MTSAKGDLLVRRALLMIAVKHLGGVLKLLGGAPGLDKGSKAKALRAGYA
jgi:hypothetical protein